MPNRDNDICFILCITNIEREREREREREKDRKRPLPSLPSVTLQHGFASAGRLPFRNLVTAEAF